MKNYRLHLISMSLIVASLVAGFFLFPTTVLAGFGIDPGKVQIDNLYPGAKAEFKIDVYNQNEYDTTFKIAPRVPDYTKDNREAFPYLGWITITPDELIIKRADKAEVTIVVKMPDDADYSDKKSETWISFKEKNDENLVQVEIVSRVLINTWTEILPENSKNKIVEQSVPVTNSSSPPSSKAIAPETSTSAITTSTQAMLINAQTDSVPESPVRSYTPWIIFGIVAGVLVVFESCYLIVKKLRHRQSTL